MGALAQLHHRQLCQVPNPTKATNPSPYHLQGDRRGVGGRVVEGGVTLAMVVLIALAVEVFFQGGAEERFNALKLRSIEKLGLPLH